MAGTLRFTRRGFLAATTVAGAGATLSYLTAGNPETLLAQQAPGKPTPGFPDDRILVIVQLSGGNDDLNTVVPYTQDEYYKQRPKLGVGKDGVLTLSDDFGLHPVCKGLKDLYDLGQLALVQGVGYPNHSRSHFNSMEIWHTGIPEGKRDSGWIGRYLANHAGENAQTVCGVNLGVRLPQAFWGSGKYGVAFTRPDEFAWAQGKGAASQEHFEELHKNQGTVDNTTAMESSDSGSSSLDFLNSTSDKAIAGSQAILDAATRSKRKTPEYPDTDFGNDMKTVANLIDGGLPARIFYVELDGFDTHARQDEDQPPLLEDFSSSVKIFLGDMKTAGHAQRITVLAFSEFGRRISENDSSGTAHGKPGTVFLCGEGVKGGFYGKFPDLTDIDGEGDIKVTTDFRSVYATVVEDWLKTPQKKVLLENYSTLPLFA